MARGWESKSVEEQVEQQSQQRESGASARDGQRSAAIADRERERMALELQRERVLDERTSNPIRRRALEAALADIEAKLAAL
jgi:trimethylamine:corrinoid methyltransferase-like protein